MYKPSDISSDQVLKDFSQLMVAILLAIQTGKYFLIVTSPVFLGPVHSISEAFSFSFSFHVCRCFLFTSPGRHQPLLEISLQGVTSNHQTSRSQPKWHIFLDVHHLFWWMMLLIYITRKILGRNLFRFQALWPFVCKSSLKALAGLVLKTLKRTFQLALMKLNRVLLNTLVV